MRKKDIRYSEINLTPQDIVKELDRYIVSQNAAKKAVAVALRNRYRRKRVPQELRNEIVPKNILMIGSTGVGKTEIARRLAKLAGAPFIKVEATKFTEVGYVGRDVESIIRDLVDIAVNMLKKHAKAEVYNSAKIHAVERILDVLTGINSGDTTRDSFRVKIHNGNLDDTEIEIPIKDTTPPGGSVEIPGMPGAAMGFLNIGDILGKAFGHKVKVKKMKIKEAIEILISEESDKLIDDEKLTSKALSLVEEEGIVFLDEIDKICSRSGNSTKGGEVSREGVQRDLLPLIEGTTVTTKHGQVDTDHILFIASGAFHLSKPSDLLPELQGRLPIRVELNSLSKDDMIKILTDTETSLIKQYKALLEVENVKLDFEITGIHKIAEIAAEFNTEVENIGARRLHTIIEKLLEEISFSASENSGKTFTIDADFVSKQLSDLKKNNDLARFML